MLFNIDGYDMGSLVPSETRNFWGGVQHIFSFSNGYDASVARYEGSYGGKHGMWEIAVLPDVPKCLNRHTHYDRHSFEDGDITYTGPNPDSVDTPVTSNIMGFVLADEILKILDTISKIEPQEV